MHKNKNGSYIIVSKNLFLACHSVLHVLTKPLLAKPNLIFKYIAHS